MYKKRAEEESSCNEDAVFPQEKNAKSEKQTSSFEITLQDLPKEMIHCILLRAVAIEVTEMKLANSVWTEKAELVMNRLQTVCSQWKDILRTEFFRNELNRILHGTAQAPIRLEILHQFPIQFRVFTVTAMKNEIFMFSRPTGEWNSQGYVINVFDRDSLDAVDDFLQLPWFLRPCLWDRMSIRLEVKDVIPLPGNLSVRCMETCSSSNCLYVLSFESVVRIEKDGDHRFKVSTWITDLLHPMPILSVSANGSLVIVSSPKEPNPQLVSIYHGENGFLQNRIALSGDIYGFISLTNVLQKPDGNLVLVWFSSQRRTELTEIDPRGRMLRQYESGLAFQNYVNFADIYGRMWITDYLNRIELVDRELNPLEFAGPWMEDKGFVYFNSDRNEVVRISYSSEAKKTVLTIFRFTDE